MFIVVKRRGLADTALKTTLKTAARAVSERFFVDVRRTLRVLPLPGRKTAVAASGRGRRAVRLAKPPVTEWVGNADRQLLSASDAVYIYKSRADRSRQQSQQSAVTNCRQLDSTKMDQH